MNPNDTDNPTNTEATVRDDPQYSWMNRYALPWETLIENSKGTLIQDSNCTIQCEGVDQFNTYKNLYGKSQSSVSNPNNNLLRCVLIVLDGSESMLNMELRPSRFFCSVKVVMDFVSKFFQKNPISQLGLAIMYSSTTKLLCHFQNGTTKLMEVLNDLISMKSAASSTTINGATVSLQNALTFALDRFQHISDGATKEVLFVCASLTTIDPYDVYSSVELLVENQIIVSAIHLAAEFQLLREIVTKTNGVFNVILDESHFISCISEHLQCQTTEKKLMDDADKTKNVNGNVKFRGKLIKLGFPNTNQSNVELNSLNILCNCHKSETFDETLPGYVSKNGYFCPVCYSKYCSLPAKCDRCSLLLVEAPYLTRSYLLSHSLGNKLSNIIPIQLEEGNNLSCHFCEKSDSIFHQCDSCKIVMCSECRDYVKNSLGFCSGCTC